MSSDALIQNGGNAAEKLQLRRSAGPTLSQVDVLRQKLQNGDFQALLELCVRNPGVRPALAQPERIEFNSNGRVTKLNLRGLPLNNLIALPALSELISLDVSSTQVCDIAPAAECGKLNRVWIDQTEVRDLSSFAGKMIVVLMANQTRVSSLDAIRKMPVLEFLGLEGTLIQGAASFAGTPNLKQLNIRNTRCTGLEELKYCVNSKAFWPRSAASGRSRSSAICRSS